MLPFEITYKPGKKSCSCWKLMLLSYDSTKTCAHISCERFYRQRQSNINDGSSFAKITNHFLWKAPSQIIDRILNSFWLHPTNLCCEKQRNGRIDRKHIILMMSLLISYFSRNSYTKLLCHISTLWRVSFNNLKSR